MGLAIGGPLAILTYGSIRDAVQSGEEMNFSLDNFTTDVPPAQLAQKIKDDWGLARDFIWWQLLQASLVCCSVGMASGLIATLAATAAQEALSSSSLAVSDD